MGGKVYDGCSSLSSESTAQDSAGSCALAVRMPRYRPGAAGVSSVRRRRHPQAAAELLLEEESTGRLGGAQAAGSGGARGGHQDYHRAAWPGIIQDRPPHPGWLLHQLLLCRRGLTWPAGGRRE